MQSIDSIQIITLCSALSNVAARRPFGQAFPANELAATAVFIAGQSFCLLPSLTVVGQELVNVRVRHVDVI